MSTDALEFGTFDLPERNAIAAKTIERFARAHAGADALFGLAGFLPIPGAGPASIVAALALQIPIYKMLASELSDVYLAPSPDSKVKGILNSVLKLDSAVSLGAGLGIHAGADVASGAVNSLAGQFGSDFFADIGGELLQEIATGFFASAIPVVGGLFSMGLDVVIAMTMTWRVGTMISIYYQNGERWLGSRHETYERAKDLTGRLSPKNEGRVDLNSVGSREAEVEEHHVEKLANFLESLLNVAPDLTDAKLEDLLCKKGVSPELAKKVVRKVRKGSKT